MTQQTTSSAQRQRWALAVVRAAADTAIRAEQARLEALQLAAREGCTQDAIAAAARLTRQGVAYHLKKGKP